MQGVEILLAIVAAGAAVFLLFNRKWGEGVGIGALALIHLLGLIKDL